jgi:hypothetical protein
MTTENELKAQIEAIVTETVNRQLAKLLGPAAKVNNYLTSMLQGQKLRYNDEPVPGSAISGQLSNFSSTGIDDRATQCQITIMDTGAVIEGTVYSSKLEVKGDAIIDGNLIITGRIPENSLTYQSLVKDAAVSAIAQLGPQILSKHQSHLFDKIRLDGIDLTKITFNGQVLLEGDKLSSVVRNSSLKTVGKLVDLHTQGETFLSETLYVSNKRVGVNTIDPTMALSIWDEEVEINLGKHKQNVAVVGTRRANTLVLSSNNNENITLQTDGTTVIPKLKVGKVLMLSSAAPPNSDMPQGTIVLNESPTLGGPLGWVSLGGARWANFGLID